MDKIHRLFNPSGIAVVGSMTAGKLGYELVRQISTGGFQPIYAVNPKAQGAFDTQGYATIHEIPKPVDVVVIAAPPETVYKTLEDCLIAGVIAAVIITSGFGEMGNIESERKIREFSKRTGLRIIGPNCAGFINTSTKLYATLEVRPPQGNMALISQSGALGGAVLSWAEEQGVGISKFVSYGNRADLDELDLLPYLANDPETAVTALYIESVKNGSGFISALKNYCKQKPLVVIKSGRTLSGQRAALSHTGSLAGSDQVYDSVLSDCGAIRVATVEEMFDLCKGFSNLPRVRGRKIAIVTNSGGPGILAADRAETAGLDVHPPEPALQQRLKNLLSPICSIQNPIDLTVQATGDDYYETIKAVLPDYDAALAINVATPYLDSMALARGISRAAAQIDKPVAANFMAGNLVADSISYLKENNIPNFPIAERGISVIARMAEYETNRVKISFDEPGVNISPKPLQTSIEGKILEPEAVQWLIANNIPVPDHYYSRTLKDVEKAAEVVGFPMVMKIVSPQILHKSEVGGVILDIPDIMTARESYKKLELAGMGKGFMGVMSYPMLRGRHEIILGFSHDPQFGPVIVFGMGGIFTEILKDISVKIAPLSFEKSMEMIRSIKGFPILAGNRNQKPSDLDSLASLISNFSTLPFMYPQIEEVDLNPVLVNEKGVVVADIRVILKELP